MVGRTLRSRTCATPAPPEDATSDAPAHSSAEPEAEPPAKRRKMITKDAKKPKPTAVKNSRKQGRLSVLPTLPLDIIYAIFEHLGPSDIVNLTRVNKNFRAILLSRQSCFLWKNVLESCEDTPDEFPCPEDVSIPFWVNMIYGGPRCDTCGARANKILWRLRRRLCKGCQKKYLVSFSDAFNLLPRQANIFNIHQFLPCDYLNGPMFLLADVKAFAEEVANIPVPRPGVNEDRTAWQEAVDIFTAPKQKEMEERMEHARRCEMSESYKTIMRTSELGQLKRQRFEDVRDRLVAEGFDMEDAGSIEIREHKEVYQAKPLTDRVWARISPILREVAREVRDQRMEDERINRQAFREEVFRMSYEEGFLPSTQPSTLSFMPSLMAVRKIPRVARYLSEDIDWQNEMTSPIELVSVVEDMAAFIGEWASRRQASLRSKLPDSLPRSTFTQAEVESFWPPAAPTVDFPRLNLFPEVADLDLAIYTFACTSPSCGKASSRVFFGIDILAHQCCYQRDLTDYDMRAEFNMSAHDAVLRILELLGLEANHTRPLDLDRADKIFVLTDEDSSSESRPLMTWRQAVEACAAAPSPAHETLELASPLEETYVQLMREVSTAGRVHKVEHEFAWGCTRCSTLVEHSVMFVAMPLVTVRKHVAESHGVEFEDAVEGRDYFHFRRTPRQSRHVFSSVEDLEGRVEFLRASKRAHPDTGAPYGIEQDLLTMSLLSMLMQA